MDPAIVGNSALFLILLAAQMDWLSGLFGDDDAAPRRDTPGELYDEALYAGLSYGTQGADILNASDFGENHAFLLLGGDDVLRASSQADYAEGGGGNDTLTMFQGDDIALGGDGDDTLLLGEGDDLGIGGAGNDTIDGSQDNDRLEGGSGDDTLTGGVGDDVVLGGDGDDRLTGYRFDEIGADHRGIDTLDGGAGDDTLLLHGADTGTGGEGGDLFQLADSQDAGALITVTDYVPGEDQIAVLYDDEGDLTAPPPTVVVTTPEGSSDALITVDGVDLATVTGAAGLTAADVMVEAFAA